MSASQPSTVSVTAAISPEVLQRIETLKRKLSATQPRGAPELTGSDVINLAVKLLDDIQTNREQGVDVVIPSVVGTATAKRTLTLKVGQP